MQVLYTIEVKDIDIDTGINYLQGEIQQASAGGSR